MILHSNIRPIVAGLSILIILIGCNRNAGLQTGQNTPPVINDVLINPVEPLAGERVTLNAITVDADGDPLTINWKVSRGKLTNNGQGNLVEYITPNDSGYVSVSCIVSDGRETASYSRTLYVTSQKLSLIGFVADEKTKNMIAGANVSLNEQTAITGDNGYFHFTDLKNRSPKLLRIQKPGYQLYSRTLNLSHGTNTVNILLERIPGKLYGIVVDSNSGSPLEGVHVALRSAVDTTTFSGYFEFSQIPPGEYTLFAKKTGYYTLRRMVDIQPGDNEIQIKL